MTGKSKAWTPERRAAASQAAKQRQIDANAGHEREVTGRILERQRKAQEQAPLRARPTRAEVTSSERRRRKPGTLNRMASYKLDIFSPEQLDPDYIYRWVNDDASRLRMVTKMDDYDYVDASEIDGFNPDDESDSEGGERVRMIVGEKKNGNPIYSYLLRKRKDFWEEDNRAQMEASDAALKRRVLKGDTPDISARVVDGGEVKTIGPDQADTSQFYVPEGAALGSPGRRRGPVSPPA